MNVEFIGTKQGMTQVFQEDGSSVPVTVVEVAPNFVTQIKRDETDGYNALQLSTGTRKPSRVTKPAAGHYAKANVAPCRHVHESRVEASELADIKLGDEIKADIFQAGEYLDVVGTTKGRGFQGTVKRHGFRTQDASHGNSLSHRVPGSIGQCQTPGRVFKNKKMAGQMGGVRRTVQSLEIVDVLADKNLLLIKGACPGAPGSVVYLKRALKKAAKA